MSQGWESRQQRTRAEILHAVGEIIAADGLDGLTMRKLADRAGVAVATLYNQFADRDGVLVAFVSSGLDQLGFFLQQENDGALDGDRTERFVGCVEHQHAMHGSEPSRKKQTPDLILTRSGASRRGVASGA